jgi:hypothetical protein
MDMEGFFVPPSSDFSGTQLSKALASVNPEFAAEFEAALSRKAGKAAKGSE